MQEPNRTRDEDACNEEAVNPTVDMTLPEYPPRKMPSDVKYEGLDFNSEKFARQVLHTKDRIIVLIDETAVFGPPMTTCKHKKAYLDGWITALSKMDSGPDVIRMPIAWKQGIMQACRKDMYIPGCLAGGLVIYRGVAVEFVKPKELRLAH